MSTERMPHPAVLLPEALDALTAVTQAAGQAVAGVDGKLLALTRLRASQINSCGPGVAQGARQALRAGATADQVHAVAAWRETPWFSDEERAALALTEAVTRLSEHADAVPDQLWDVAAKHFDQRELAALLLNVAVTNLFDRLTVPTRQQAGAR